MRGRFGPIPAILVTADRDGALRLRAAQADIDLLHKPLKPAALRALLARKAALAAAEGGDYSLFRKLLGILQRPYDDQAEVSEYSQPPQPSERVLQTFCGT